MVPGVVSTPTVKAPLLSRRILPPAAAFVDVIKPLLNSELPPLRFIVMSLLPARVTPALTVVLPVLLVTTLAPVIVRSPPVAPPVLLNVRAPVGLKLICPPALVIDPAAVPAAASRLTVRAPPLLVRLMAVEALVVVMPAVSCRTSWLASNVRLFPVETVSFTPELIVIVLPTKRDVPVAPGLNACEAANVRLFAPADMVIVPEAPPEKEIVPPTAPRVILLELRMLILPAACVDVIVPLLAKPAFPFTFIVMLLSDLTVVLAATVVTPVPVVVAVTVPPLRLIVPRLLKVKFVLTGCVI